MSLTQHLAFVDLETTGGSATHDRITEIAIVRVTPDGVHEWSSLVNPQRPIPQGIQALTGITDAMVAEAPTFEALAGDVAAMLDGHLFVAHNARFDHGFLKNAFARMGADLRTTVLCTVRLSRRLFPEHDGHGLDALIARHGLAVGEAAGGRHRALGDARAIHQFWRLLGERFGADVLTAAVRRLTAQPSLPPQLPADLPDRLPRGAGVYQFFGENDLPLYVGKAVDLRRRVLSHFSADHRRPASMELSQQVRRVTWQETSGEIGALLNEARLVKHSAPLYNRQLRPRARQFAWRLVPDLISGRLVLTEPNDPGLGIEPGLYGLSGSKAAARGWLRALAEEHNLCEAHLGLEKKPAGKPCFARQVRRCLGACVGEESAEAHFERLAAALKPHWVEPWPYAGPVAIEEAGTFHVLHRWTYVGSVERREDASALAERERATPFDPDVYRILRTRAGAAFLANAGARGRELFG